jgi:hypothetical protein
MDESHAERDTDAARYNSLTEENVQLLEHGPVVVSSLRERLAPDQQINDVQQGSAHPTYAETSNHLDGIKDFNRESVLHLDPTLKNSKRHSDSSAEYSDYFRRADMARELGDSESQNSLKQYKTYQSTASPFERWITETKDWPDQAVRLANGEQEHREEFAGQHDADSLDGGDITGANADSHKQTQGVIEVEERDEVNLSKEEIKQAMKKYSRTVKSGDSRVQKDTKLRVRKPGSQHRR